MSKTILVTGATGKQGGSVIENLANNPEFTLLAVTRNTAGGSAQKLTSKGSNIKLVQGDMDDVVLALIDADAGRAGNQAFRLDAGGAFSAGEIRLAAAAGGDLLPRFSTDGDAAAELPILVENRTALLGAELQRGDEEVLDAPPAFTRHGRSRAPDTATHVRMPSRCAPSSPTH